MIFRLEAPRSLAHTPIFQCFIDYRLGLRQRDSLAGCQLELLSFQPSKVTYDIALDIIDDPNDDCHIMLILRKDIYSDQDAEDLAKSYERLIKQFSQDSNVTLGEPSIFDSLDTERALSFSRGERQPL